ncbi:MAG TPA: ABC transporter ATP-binding protein [Candidatus Hydrogenedentes bacterium]|nr:ABC transporter ATP-binding protein [Candidatus Hydrogenedentota bacterium]HOH50124.1 ABC transporter ATP-binding protein [Candidatus Hydrogenedentota bacterium]HRZ83374.1 ABC transporter ATP-binding protein [Candidatus Hydrogenedentota bacterium]
MMQAETMVELQRVTKTYNMGAVSFNALDDVSLAVGKGEYAAIMGPSGCGKSTMLNLLGCLDRPTTGKYLLGGLDVSTLDDDDLSTVRGACLGFIFQSYNLIQQLNVVENIEVPLYYQGRHPDESREIAVALAERVGLGERVYHKPFELSGGQQQRVGIARALANSPLVLMADEPTGNLDSRSGQEILALFDELHGQGMTIIMVTHDEGIGARAQRVIRLRDGRVEEDRRNG